MRLKLCPSSYDGGLDVFSHWGPKLCSTIHWLSDQCLLCAGQCLNSAELPHEIPEIVPIVCTGCPRHTVARTKSIATVHMHCCGYSLNVCYAMYRM